MAGAIEGWRERVAKMVMVAKLAPGAGWACLAGLAACRLVVAVVPLGTAVATGVLIGRVPAAARDGLGSAAGRDLLRMLAVLAALTVVQELMWSATGALSLVVSRRVDNDVRERIRLAMLRPTGIEHLEDPAVLDQVALATGESVAVGSPGGAVTSLASLVARFVQTIGALAILARFSVILAGLFLLVILVLRSAFRGGLTSGLDALVRSNPGMRRATYTSTFATSPSFAKEVRTFGLGPWVGRRYEDEAMSSWGHIWDVRIGVYKRFGKAWLFFLVMLAAILILLTRAAVAGEISVAALMVYLQAVFRSMAAVGAGDDEIQLIYGTGALPAVTALEAPVARADSRPAPPGAPVECIRFAGVGFTYPSRTTPVFEGLDLEIRAGSSLAIVGLNGAGKTTLVKLLSRLVEPTEGSILVDGIDLRDIDPASWRERLAVIFQDFTRLELSARDNVSLAALDRDVDPKRLATAAELSGLGAFIEDLPHGWDTVLAPGYTGGTDLSGGQWQRVALARALLAVGQGATVLVLDEPTANLDVRAELALFDRFLDLTAGLTTILISHRFSTVRRADRIVSISKGRVVEDGSHDALVAAGGGYAEMFHVQAARFAEADASDEV